jgi:putative Mg2+ transporter-C (MgtC) family protein
MDKLAEIFDSAWPYMGDLHKVISPHWSGIVLVLCSVACGLLIGAERETKKKAAGLRTITLICVGSTLFTFASILIAGEWADRTRIAAQVVTGVGFLGAGAILQHRGTIIGLTTGATIWTAAAIGVLVGGGYGAAGLVLTLLVVGLMIVEQRIEDWILGACRYTHVHVAYQPDNGKTRIRLLRVLDEFRIPDSRWEVATEGELEVADVQYCHFHQQHRAILLEIVNLPGIVEIRRHRTARQVNAPVPPEQ